MSDSLIDKANGALAIALHHLQADGALDRTLLAEAIGVAKDAIAIIHRHYEGRPAVDGKPLELMTRDELLAAYIKARKGEQSGDAVERVIDAIHASPLHGMPLDDCREVAKAAIAAMGGWGHTTTESAVASPASDSPSEMRLISEVESKLRCERDRLQAQYVGWDVGDVMNVIRPYLRTTEPVATDEIPDIEFINVINNLATWFLSSDKHQEFINMAYHGLKPYIRTTEPVSVDLDSAIVAIDKAYEGLGFDQPKPDMVLWHKGITRELAKACAKAWGLNYGD